MISIKLKILNEFNVDSYINSYSKLKRIAYNKLIDGASLIETQKFIKSNIKHDLDASFVEYASLDAEQIKDSQEKLKIKKIVFGGKKNLIKLNKKQITKNDWKQLRNPYLYTIGRANEKYGNRKFKLDFISNKCIYFCPNRNVKIKLDVVSSSSQEQLLNKIETLAKNFKLAVTYKLTRTHIVLVVDESKLSDTLYTPINNRILSLDLNPNSIGLTICDFDDNNKQSTIFKQIYNLKLLNKCGKFKKQHENFQIVKSIIKLCDYYRVESIGIEKLNIESKDNKKGKGFNKTINNDWIRVKFINNLKKHCNLNNIKIYDIAASYSSFIGCLMNGDEIDSIAAALEIGRRTNLFIKTFIKEILPRDTKIIFPEWNDDLMNPWKKELSAGVILNWKNMFKWFQKNPKLSYRNFLSDVESSRFLRFLHRRSNILLYNH